LGAPPDLVFFIQKWSHSGSSDVEKFQQNILAWLLGNQMTFLLPGEPFQPVFDLPRKTFVTNLTFVDQAHRQARTQVPRSASLIVAGYPLLDIRADTRIEAAIGSLSQVHPPAFRIAQVACISPGW